MRWRGSQAWTCAEAATFTRVPFAETVITLRILALLPEAHGACACLDAALAAACVEPDARVEAFHVKVDPAHLLRAPEEIAIQHLRERDEGTAEDQERAVRQVFTEWVETLTPQEQGRVTWREVVGAEDEFVAKEAKGADLLVLAKPRDMDAGDAFHAALFESHRPLLIPAGWRREGRQGLAERIAIAWRPTDQARLAVRQATPWLKAAKSVVVLQVSEHSAAPDPAEIGAMLGGLALRFETLTRPADQRDPGETLLAMVEESGADALVMGAYRHNEWIEWAMGGTTRFVLAHARVPLLLAH